MKYNIIVPNIEISYSKSSDSFIVRNPASISYYEVTVASLINKGYFTTRSQILEEILLECEEILPKELITHLKKDGVPFSVYVSCSANERISLVWESIAY